MLYPGERGSRPVPTEQSASKRSRTVFLTTREAEDMCWPTESVYFVIDTGVQKEKVNQFQFSIKRLKNEKLHFCW